MVYTDISTIELQKFFRKTKGQLTECLKEVCNEFTIIDQKMGKSKHEFLFVFYESQDEGIVYTKLGSIKSNHEKINIGLELLEENKYQIEVKDY